jgi:hypothetical protein
MQYCILTIKLQNLSLMNYNAGEWQEWGGARLCSRLHYCTFLHACITRLHYCTSSHACITRLHYCACITRLHYCASLHACITTQASGRSGGIRTRESTSSTCFSTGVFSLLAAKAGGFSFREKGLVFDAQEAMRFSK